MTMATALTTHAPTIRFTPKSVALEADGEGGEVLMAQGHVSCTACGYPMSVVVEYGLLGHGYCPTCTAEHWYEHQTPSNPHLEVLGQPADRVDMRQADLTVRYSEGL